VASLRNIVAALAASGVVASCVTVAMPPHVAPASEDVDATIAAPRRLGSTAATPTSFSYRSGTSGAVVIPPLYYVTSILACASQDGGAASFTISPVGETADGSTLDGAVAGTSIPVPVGCISPPNLSGAIGSLGPGTTLTFTATSAYYVGLEAFGSF